MFVIFDFFRPYRRIVLDEKNFIVPQAPGFFSRKQGTGRFRIGDALLEPAACFRLGFYPDSFITQAFFDVLCRSCIVRRIINLEARIHEQLVLLAVRFIELVQPLHDEHGLHTVTGCKGQGRRKAFQVAQ